MPQNNEERRKSIIVFAFLNKTRRAKFHSFFALQFSIFFIKLAVTILKINYFHKMGLYDNDFNYFDDYYTFNTRL